MKRLWRSGLIFIWWPFRCPSSNQSADSQIPSEPTAAQYQSVSQPVSQLLQGWGSVHGGMLHTCTATSRRLSLTSAMTSNNRHLDCYYNDINSAQMLSSGFPLLSYFVHVNLSLKLSSRGEENVFHLVTHAGYVRCQSYLSSSRQPSFTTLIAHFLMSR